MSPLGMRIISFIVLAVFPAVSFAQYITVDTGYTAEQLVEDILINSPCANVSNFQASGWSEYKSYGYFTAGTGNFPFAEGVLLTTGKAVSAIGPNTSLLSEGASSWSGDTDLQQAIQESNTVNATILEFDFLPVANKITFEYIFSSEQYLAYSNSNQCGYSDGFAFLLKEVNGQDPYENLAVVPGTNTPVKVTTIRGSGTICPASNEQYFDAFNDAPHPTNYNGQTVILQAEATVTPGMLYHMKLVIADQGNAYYDSAIFLGGGSFAVETDLGPNLLINEGTALCAGESYVLDATQEGSGHSYQWFQDSVLIPGETSETFTVTQPGVYSVEIALGNTGCNTRGEVAIEYFDPVTVFDTTLFQCVVTNTGLATFDLFDAAQDVTGGEVNLDIQGFYTSFTNASNDLLPISNPSAYNNTVPNQVIYARVVDENGCFAVAEITLKTNFNRPDPVTLAECSFLDNPDHAQFSLTDATALLQNEIPEIIQATYHATLNDALSGSSPLPASFENTVPASQEIFARITSEADCYGIASVFLEVLVSPQLEEDTSMTYCINTFPEPIMLSSGLTENISSYSFLWNTGATTPTLFVNEAGTYNVTVTRSETINGQVYSCSADRTFSVVNSEIAQLSYFLMGNYGRQTINVVAEGSGNYLFSLDNGPYQESPVFPNVAGGVHTVSALDLKGCGTQTIVVYIVDFPNYFTPNGDGYNDHWTLGGLDRDNNPLQKVEIFDRFGKILHVLDFRSRGWDGTFKGRPLPSSDYWFKAYFQDGGIFKGHFTLKR